MYFSLRKKRGFTLVEILIVVAIIGFLASIALFQLAPASKKGRDTRRIADLGHVQAALEVYFTKNGCYPNPSGSCPGSTGSMTWPTLTTAIQGASIGYSSLPNDPVSGRDYFYGSDGTSYIIGARLEDANNNPNNRSNINHINLFSIDCTGPDMYCVIP